MSDDGYPTFGQMIRNQGRLAHWTTDPHHVIVIVGVGREQGGLTHYHATTLRQVLIGNHYVATRVTPRPDLVVSNLHVFDLVMEFTAETTYDVRVWGPVLRTSAEWDECAGWGSKGFTSESTCETMP